MNFKKSVNDYFNSGKDLSDFILSQHCGYISRFRTNNYSPVSSTYSNNGKFCSHECIVCVHKNNVCTACPNIRKIRQEQFNEPKVADEMEAKGYGSKKN